VKITILCKQIIFFPILGGRAPGAPPGSAPAYILATVQQISAQYYLLQIVFFVCGGSTRST